MTATTLRAGEVLARLPLTAPEGEDADAWDAMRAELARHPLRMVRVDATRVLWARKDGTYTTSTEEHA